MKIALGCDKLGCALASAVGDTLRARGVEVVDLGEPEDYYKVGLRGALMVGKGEADRAVLVCGSGMGMAIVANKVSGVYAALCENVAAARGARRINNANVLCLGGNVTSSQDAVEMVEAFLNTPFASDSPDELKQWLDQSMVELAAIEKRQFA